MSLCLTSKIHVELGATLRGPEAQAKLWCRSKTPEDVAERRAVIAQSAPRLASLLKDEYACLGPQITTHLPGQSWHQWGEAVDVCAVIPGRCAIWDGSTALFIAKKAQLLGLRHSYLDKRLQPNSRHWHIQLCEFSTPFLARRLYSWAELEEEMIKRFDI